MRLPRRGVHDRDGRCFGLIALAVYIGHCAIWPYRRCPWCKGKTRTIDGHGNYRLRRPCPVCDGQPFRRLGARLIGRG